MWACIIEPIQLSCKISRHTSIVSSRPYFDRCISKVERPLCDEGLPNFSHRYPFIHLRPSGWGVSRLFCSMAQHLRRFKLWTHTLLIMLNHSFFLIFRYTKTSCMAKTTLGFSWVVTSLNGGRCQTTARIAPQKSFIPHWKAIYPRKIYHLVFI